MILLIRFNSVVERRCRRCEVHNSQVRFLKSVSSRTDKKHGVNRDSSVNSVKSPLGHESDECIEVCPFST